MSLELIRADITKVDADVIVNSANPGPSIGGGVDNAIYAAADADRMLADRIKIGPLEAGETAVTPAYGMKQKYVIHAVAPVWHGGYSNEEELLRKTYRRSLELAKELEAELTAFPLLSAGVFGYPKDQAINVAVSEISKFLYDNEMTVYLVIYNREAFELSSKVYEDIESFINEEDVLPPEYDMRRNLSQARPLMGDRVYGGKPADLEGDIGAPLEDDLDDIVNKEGETFQERLFRIIDRKGLSDIEVYKKANIDRKHFSKIKGNKDYNPSKRTAAAFAIALGLNLDETNDLLLTAGYALTNSKNFDKIIRYSIERGIYDVNEINCFLFKYGEPTLGA